MLLKLRDKNDDLVIKDMLDIGFDMKVVNENGKYYVKLNRNYFLDGEFKKKSDAEEEMLHLADIRNQLENELRNF